MRLAIPSTASDPLTESLRDGALPGRRLPRLNALLFASFAFAVKGFGCTEVGDPALVIETPFEVPAGPLSFAEHIEPILLDGGCQGCHASGGGFGGLDATSAAALRAGGDTGPAVVPCDSAGSYLWQRVRDCEMPATGACLDDAEVAAIARWIDQGAQDEFDASICPDAPLE
jgi:hypothetical protein